MPVDIAAILATVASLPSMIDSSIKLASELRVGLFGTKEAKRALESKLADTRKSLSEFALLGRSVRDYASLLAISIDLNNRADLFLKSVLRYLREAKEESTAQALMEELFTALYSQFQADLMNFFTSNRFLSQTDEGSFGTLIKKIGDQMRETKAELRNRSFVSAERLLKEASENLNEIAAKCNAQIDTMTERFINYETQNVE